MSDVVTTSAQGSYEAAVDAAPWGHDALECARDQCGVVRKVQLLPWKAAQRKAGIFG